MSNSIVFNEDCVEGMKRFKDKYFDLAICDVPYGINVGKMAYLQENKTTVLQRNGKRINGNQNKTIYLKKDWDSGTPTQEYFNELQRVSKHQIIFGVQYVNWSGLGNGCIRWDKCVAEGMSFKTYEFAYCSMIDYVYEFKLLWSGMNQAKSLSEPTTQRGNKKNNEKRIHPTHKPILLYDKLILEFAKPNMKILDTHLGSGSSRIAAYKAGLDFTGFEIDRDYYDAQEKRFKTFTDQLSIL